MEASLTRFSSLTRRRVLRDMASALPAAMVGWSSGIPRAFAQDSFSASIQRGHWRELGDLAVEAARLGYATPRFSATLSAQDPNDYGQVMRATVDLIETIDFNPRPPAAAAAPDETERLSRKSHALLRRVHQLERSPPTDREGSSSLATVPSWPTFESIKDDYDKLFATCTVREKNRSDVNWNVSKLTDKRYQERWLAAAQEVCCPWYFVGLIHCMEASFDFSAHLHNGDPLSEKTVQVPKGRPAPWNPPSDWVSSAKDALTYDGFANVQDWTVAHTLYRLRVLQWFSQPPERHQHAVPLEFLEPLFQGQVRRRRRVGRQRGFQTVRRRRDPESARRQRRGDPAAGVTVR